MEKETPHWENNNNYNNNISKSKYLSQFVGKNCCFFLTKLIFLPSYDNYETRKIDAFFEGYDEYFIHITYTAKKKKYKSIIDINTIISITTQEEG